MRVLYDKVEIPRDRVTMNIGYDPAALDDHKRQLDLYLPEGRGWPTVIFIHGGGWAWGDRAQTFGGQDVYGNIGRFLAREGFGAAVISYRLIWKTDWRTQATDVARAVTWVHQNIAARGGDPRKVFLMGHSAGAQLAMRIAVDPQWLAGVGAEPQAICGVVAVSGAGYDLEDRVAERLDQDERYYVQRFGGSVREDLGAPATYAWRREASVLPSLDAADPPFLSMMAEGDYASIQHQVRLADERLGKLGLSRGFVIVANTTHERIVLELSRGDHVAGPAVLKFLRDMPCPRHEITKHHDAFVLSRATGLSRRRRRCCPDPE
jgi:acetyl esterase/lipase